MWNPFKKKEIISLNIEGAGENAVEQKFDSAKAEQMEMFGDKSPREIGHERLIHAIDLGEKTFNKVSEFFKRSLGGRAGKMASSTAALDKVFEKGWERTRDFLTKDLASSTEELYARKPARMRKVSAAMDAVGAGLDNFLGFQRFCDLLEDVSVKRWAKRLGLKNEDGSIPEVPGFDKNTILGLNDEERSMGGQLLLGHSIFEYDYHYEQRLRTLLDMFDRQQERMLEKRKVEEKKLAELKKTNIQQMIERARSGEFIKLKSYGEFEKLLAEAESLGIRVEQSSIKIQIGEEKKSE